MIEIKEIFYNIDALNFEDMIHKVGKVLKNKGYVNEGFEKNIIKREKTYPTGLSFSGLDIAIPHTDPKYVEKSGVIAIKLKKPIDMIHMATSDKKLKVENLFLLLVDEGKLQIDLLTKLMNLFNKEEIKYKLKHINSPNKLKNIFA